MNETSYPTPSRLLIGDARAAAVDVRGAREARDPIPRGVEVFAASSSTTKITNEDLGGEDPVDNQDPLVPV